MTKIAFICHTQVDLDIRRAALEADERALTEYTEQAVREYRATPPEQLGRHEALFLAALDGLAAGTIAQA